MELKVIGSGSSGNCYSITDKNGTSLIIEAGIHWKKFVEAMDFDLSGIIACLVSHEHMADHAKATGDFLKAGIPVFCSQGTADNIPFKTSLRPKNIESEKQFQIGDFIILPLDTIHDAAEPLGFLIYHPECGSVLFATDTRALNYDFPNVNHWMIEANYSEKILLERIEKDNLNTYLANRIYENHMSFETCLSILKQNADAATRTITLIHLSDSNADGESFQKQISRELGIKPYIATEGLTINLFK